MGSCTNMEAFHQNLLQLVNNCHLTIGEAYYVIKDVCNELHILYIKEIQNEQKAPQETVEQDFVPFVEEDKEEVMENGEQNND